MSELTLWYNLQDYQTLIDTPTEEAIYNLFEDCLCMREEIERQQAEIERLTRISNDHIQVPIGELQKLEEIRVALYEFLGTRLSEWELLHLANITGQMWSVANRKNWMQQEVLKHE